MSKFKQGDRVRNAACPSTTAVILGVHKDQYWVEYQGNTYYSTRFDHFDRYYELAPEPFLPNGEDRYYNYYANGYVGTGHPTLAEAESTNPNVPKIGIIRIDGETGEPSWVKGGPKKVRS